MLIMQSRLTPEQTFHCFFPCFVILQRSKGISLWKTDCSPSHLQQALFWCASTTPLGSLLQSTPTFFLVLIHLWKRSGSYTILTRDKCFIQMLLSHIVGEVMNPGAGAWPGSPCQVKLGCRSKIKSNVSAAARKVHKSGLLICMGCKEPPGSMQK